MALLTATKLVSAGIDIATLANADAAGDSWVNGGTEKLVVRNDGADPHTVTIPRLRTVDGKSAAAQVVTVAAGGLKIIGPFRPADYNNDDGEIEVAYDAVEETGPVQVLFVKLVKG